MVRGQREGQPTHMTGFSDRLGADRKTLELWQNFCGDDLMKSGKVGVDLLEEQGVELINLLNLGGYGCVWGDVVDDVERRMQQRVLRMCMLGGRHGGKGVKMCCEQGRKGGPMGSCGCG